MNHLTTVFNRSRSHSHHRERTVEPSRAAMIRFAIALCVGLLCCVIPSATSAQSPIGCFGYSDTWTSYTPTESVMQHPATQMLINSANTSPNVSCGEAGCGESSNCGCGVCPCDESCRTYAVDVSSVFFRRNRLDGRLLFFNPVATSEQIDASQFDIGFTPGIEAGLIAYNQQTRTDFEFRSIWLNEWTSDVSRSFTGGTVQIHSTPPLATTGPRTALSSYDSRFWSAEFNVRYRLQSRPKTTLLAGFRTMRLDDELNASLADPLGLIPDELIQTVTRNRLFGLQIGADYVLRNSCNWCVRLKGRAGLYGNAGSQQSALISLAVPPVIFPAADDSSDLAFHAELGAEGKFRLSNCSNLLFGYRVMTVDGLAIATEQIREINFLNQAGYQGKGRVVMQAINIGVEFVY